MKSTGTGLCAVLAGVLTLGSCAKDSATDATQNETKSLRAWMAQHRKDLLDNFQPVGNSGYYVDVIRECKEGAENARPIGDTSIWVRFNATVRDLDGNIVLTRNADHAKLLNTFTKYTRYVPFYRYCGAENAGLTEGVWLAMHNPLSLDNGTRTARLRIGAVADLYLHRFWSAACPLPAVTRAKRR